MDIQVTLAELAVLWKHELDRNCATTLVVINIATLRRSECYLVAGGTVGHFIVNENVCLPRCRKMEPVGGKWSVDSIHSEHVIIIPGKLSNNTFALFY